MKKPFAILFDMGDTLIEYHENNTLKGTEELLKKANNPDSITANEIQEYVVGAQNAGILPIWFNKQNNIHEQSDDIIEVKSFDEVRDYLVSLIKYNIDKELYCFNKN